MVRGFLLFFLALFGSPVLAGEAIEDFAVRIWLEPDASLTVEENLRVRVENVAINHGIYRDLLTRPPAATGTASLGRIAYTIEEARLDGRPVPWLVREGSGSLRVYLGDPERTVPPGPHTFTLRYRARYAAVRAGERARLDWNVTGNDWNFPIHAVHLRLELPPALRADAVEGRVYYGPVGATTHLPLTPAGTHALTFDYASTLPPGSGLTLELTWPAALLEPPRPPLDPTLRVLLLALLVFLFTSAYAWFRAGRDPYAGPVIPRFEPPEGVSAALAAYLMGGGYNTRVFSAAVAELSQRGLLSLSDGTPPALKKAARASEAALPRELRDFYDALFAGREVLALDQAHAADLQEAQNALKGNLEVRTAPLLRNNNGWVLAGLAIPAAALGWLAYQSEREFAVAVFAAFAYAAYALVAAGMLRMAAQAWERYRLIPGLSPLRELFRAAVFGLGALLTPLVVAMLVGVFQGLAVGVVVGLMLLAGALAAYLIPAYTREGARLRNHLLGLARYLGTTDEAALRRIGAPEDVPEHLNALFPYAVALGLEAPFGRRLAAFARLHPRQARNVVVWNRPLEAETAGRTGADLSRYTASITRALRAAAARAQSSGGSTGGGFSGGGGGGGGGGGW